MDINALATRLQTLEEESIRDLHNQLLTTCTGRAAESRPEILRDIAIIETTDSLRGALLRDLLGAGEGLDDRWLPDGMKNRMFPNATIRYRCDLSVNRPSFHQEIFNFSRITLDSEAALSTLKSGTSSSKEPISIETHFSGLPSGWSCWITPTISPHSNRPDVARLLPQDTCWVLVCRNLHAANAILSRISTLPPVLVVLDDAEESIPTHVGDIRVVPRSDASAQIRDFCERTELFSKPDKSRMIRAILDIQQHASGVVSQGEKHTTRHQNFQRILERSGIAWELMFIDERRAARQDLQLKTVSHPMQKTLLIMRGEREAHVNHYVRTHLIPLIKNFLKSQCLELKSLEIHPPDLGQFQTLPIEADHAKHLRAGLLFALPSIGLIFPNIPIQPTALAAIPSQLQSNPLETSEVSHGLFSPITDKFHILFDDAKEGLTDLLSAPFEAMTGQLQTLNQGIASLIGILVAGQVAVVIGVAIAAVIQIRGTLSLTETETMLDDLLNKTESMWPQIEENLKRLLPAFNGAVDEEILCRARKALYQIENL